MMISKTIFNTRRARTPSNYMEKLLPTSMHQNSFAILQVYSINLK